MTTRTRTRAYRAAVTATGAAAALVAPLASPAVADPAATLALLAVAEVWPETFTATSASVCASGYVDHGRPISGYWIYHVAGPTARYVTPVPGAAFAKTCHPITTTGVPAGTTEASVEYIGINGDVLANCTATLTWAPGVRLTWAHNCLNEPPAP